MLDFSKASAKVLTIFHSTKSFPKKSLFFSLILTLIKTLITQILKDTL